MRIQQIKDVAEAMEEKGFMSDNDKDIWSKFLSPSQVLELLERIEQLELQAQRKVA